jgi:hypothetical protein
MVDHNPHRLGNASLYNSYIAEEEAAAIILMVYGWGVGDRLDQMLMVKLGIKAGINRTWSLILNLNFTQKWIF